MRVAIQNPSFIFEDQVLHHPSCALEYLKLFRPALFLTSWTQVWSYSKRLRELGLNPLGFRFLLSQSALIRHVDVLICFNGAVDKSENCPIAAFPGLKIAHIGDFYHNPRQALQNLKDSKVDYLIGHGNHAKYSPLFREHFAEYCDRLLPVPIGFSPDFHKRRAFDARVPKCLLTVQTPGPICDPRDRDGCRDYYEHYSQNEVCFPWLAQLRSKYFECGHLLELHVEEDLFRGRSSHGAIQKLNEYQLFTAESGLLGFLCARVYEGVAAGAVLIAPEHGCFKELGFEHGKNCLMHRPGDMESFKECLEFALSKPSEMAQIADRATHWVHASFSRESIAKWLHESIAEMASCRKATL